MADLDFSQEELLEQARGNQTSLWHLAVRRAREREGSVDAWAAYVGEQFAPSWDEFGDDASVLDIARAAARNIATTADMQLTGLEGDASRAVVTAEGPDQEWIDLMGTTLEDLDRTMEGIFRPIMERRGVALTTERTGDTFRMTLARQA